MKIRPELVPETERNNLEVIQLTDESIPSSTPDGSVETLVSGQGADIHPFLSPDGQSGFFNSDESGILQAYMVRGWS